MTQLENAKLVEEKCFCCHSEGPLLGWERGMGQGSAWRQTGRHAEAASTRVCSTCAVQDQGRRREQGRETKAVDGSLGLHANGMPRARFLGGWFAPQLLPTDTRVRSGGSRAAYVAPSLEFVRS